MVSVGSVEIDPADDFNFNPKIQQSSLAERYSDFTVREVREILAERLDLVPLSQVPALARHLVKLCHYYQFDPAFILSIIQTESAFRVKAISNVGAIGLMQLMPATAYVVVRDMDLPIDPRFKKALRMNRRYDSGLSAFVINRRVLTDPMINISLGIAYLANLRDHYHGKSQDYLLAAYNMGPARVDELVSEDNFRPHQPIKYIESVRRGVSKFRSYRRPVDSTATDGAV